MRVYFAILATLLALLAAQAQAGVLPKIEQSQFCSQSNTMPSGVTEAQIQSALNDAAWALNENGIAYVCFDTETTYTLSEPLTIAPHVPLTVYGLNINTSHRIHIRGAGISLQNSSITNTGDQVRGALIVEGSKNSFYDLTITGEKHPGIIGVNTLRADGDLYFENIAVTDFDYGFAIGGSDNQFRNLSAEWIYEEGKTPLGREGFHLSLTRSRHSVLDSITSRGFDIGINLQGQHNKLLNNITLTTFQTEAPQTIQGAIGLRIHGDNNSTTIMPFDSDNHSTNANRIISSYAIGIQSMGSSITIEHILFDNVDTGISGTMIKDYQLANLSFINHGSGALIDHEHIAQTLSNSTFQKQCTSIDECNWDLDETQDLAIIGQFESPSCLGDVALYEKTVTENAAFHHVVSMCEIIESESKASYCEYRCEHSVDGNVLALSPGSAVWPYLFTETGGAALTKAPIVINQLQDDDIIILVPQTAVTMNPNGGNAMTATGTTTMTPVGPIVASPEADTAPQMFALEATVPDLEVGGSVTEENDDANAPDAALIGVNTPPSETEETPFLHAGGQVESSESTPTPVAGCALIVR